MDKLENWGSKFALVTLAAKRAKQLKSGARSLVDTDSRNPLTVALEEIAAGKVTCVVSDADLIIQPALEPEVAQLLALPVEPEEAVEAGEEEALATASQEAPAADLEKAKGEETGETEEAEEEEEEEEEEHDEWQAALDEELAAGEHPLKQDEETPPADVDAGAEGLAEAPAAEVEPKPKARRGRKPRTPDVDVPVEIQFLDAGAEESEEEND